MSEFGTGFIYNLVLFAMHYERLGEYIKYYKTMRIEHPDLFSDSHAISLWFNGASDHFYELNVPPQWQETKIGKLTLKLKHQALSWGHGIEAFHDISKKEFDNFFDDIKKLCRLIDKELGVTSEKGDWE